ncbi:MAG: peptidyl-prolyl cis-trans isomerase [Alphaproteobacteria bacterium]|nr:peptidyl-prolyl cis-trans isomerase [Alphaproteobacteria bacterium]
MQKKYVLTGVAVVAAAVLGAIYYMDSGVPSVKTSTLKLKASMPKPALQKVVNPENKGVAARVNGEIISIEEIRKGYMDNPQIAEQVPFDEFYQKAVDVFVNGKLLYQAATKANVESLPEYQEQLKTAKEDLARKVYIEKQVDEKVTDDAVAKFYQDEYVAKFVSKKEMGAKHILVDNEKTAKEVIEKLNKKGDFDKLAKEYTKDKTVELGYFTEDLMVPEFVAAAKKLKKGEYTKQPVKTQFGYHIILLEDIRDAKPLPLKDLEPQIRNILSQQAIAQTFDDLYAQGSVEKFDLNGNKMPDEPAEK